MRAYYYDNTPGNQTALHDSGKEATEADLRRSGLEYKYIPVDDDGRWEQEIDAVARERVYKNRDIKESSRAVLGDEFGTNQAAVWAEHLHEDEEIRFVLQGNGFFDFRETVTDKWVRTHVSKGDLLVVPAGIYHRFSLDSNEHMKAMRLFKDEQKWTAHYRSAETDTNPHRVEYLKSVQVAA